MKKLILVQAILFLLACQSSLAFSFDGTMDTLASRIFSTFKSSAPSLKGPRRNQIDTQDGISKLAQEIKNAAQNGRSENTTGQVQGKPLMGTRRNNVNATQSNQNTIPEGKMSKLARSFMNVFQTIEQQQKKNSSNTNNSNKSHRNETIISNTSSPATPKPTQNNTSPVVVVVETNKTQEETNQTNNGANTTTVQQPPKNVTEEKPVDIPQMTISDECSNQIKDTFAVIFDLGIKASAQSIDGVKHDYEILKNITNNLNKACAKSFSINMHPEKLFNNSGVCTDELDEITKITIAYLDNPSKDVIYFTKTLQSFWYRYDNFMSSCSIKPMEQEPKENPTTTTSGNIGIDKPETPQMMVSAECSSQIKNSFAIIYDLGVHASAQNIERVKSDYEALKNITTNLNKACGKSFSINMKPAKLFDSSGVCTNELDEITKITIAYLDNTSSKDTIYFAKTIQSFWYRYDNFMSSCSIKPMEQEPKKNTTTPSGNIGIDKPETPQMTVAAECSAQIQNSFAIIYDLGVHAAAQNIERIKRDYETLKTITTSLNKACAKTFSINMKPAALFSSSNVCSIELEEIRKLAMEYSQNSSNDMIYFAKTIQGFWYRYDNFVSSCVSRPAEQPKAESEQLQANCLMSFAEANAAVHRMSGNILPWNMNGVKILINNLHNRIAGINKYCDAQFSVNLESTQTHVAQGKCQKDLSLLKTAVEQFETQESKELDGIAQSLRQISYIGKQIINDC